MNSGVPASGKPMAGSASQAPAAELLDVKAVAALLGCSTRHVGRLVERNRMPAPIKLGVLVRWSRAALLAWIGQGCPTKTNELDERRAARDVGD